MELAERFWKRADMSGGPEACWLWQGRINPKTGYGEFDRGDRRIFVDRSGHQALAHRVAFFLYYGTINQSLLVCHTCDVRICVNYVHLFQGTHKDNAQDAVRKGRTLSGERNFWCQHPEKVRRGEDHNMAKLSDQQAEDIQKRYASGDISQRALASEYEVKQYTVWRIVNGKRGTNA